MQPEAHPEERCTRKYIISSDQPLRKSYLRLIYTNFYSFDLQVLNIHAREQALLFWFFDLGLIDQIHILTN